jgi:hypothetical protein
MSPDVTGATRSLNRRHVDIVSLLLGGSTQIVYCCFLHMLWDAEPTNVATSAQWMNSLMISLASMMVRAYFVYRPYDTFAFMFIQCFEMGSIGAVMLALRLPDMWPAVRVALAAYFEPPPFRFAPSISKNVLAATAVVLPVMLWRHFAPALRPYSPKYKQA